MATRCFCVSESFPVQLERNSPKKRAKSNKKTKTQYYRSVKNWTKDDWKLTGGIENKKGCYIYFWHEKPIYVGMTVSEKGFQNECFHSHKTGNREKDGKGILTDFLQKEKIRRCRTKKNAMCKSPLTLLFIYWNGRPDANIEDVVNDMESYLITKALEKNPKLLNSKKTTKWWSIPGFDGEPEGDENGRKLNILLTKKKRG